MNIMKTNMLSLNNKRIMNEEPENGTEAKSIIRETDDSQKSMNALTFQGLNNVISNPQLSSKLGNVVNSAKEGIKNNGAKALSGMMLVSTLLPSALLVSCDKDSFEAKQEQKFQFNIDKMEALLQQLYDSNLLTLQELQQMRADINSYKADQEAYKDAVLGILTKIGDNVIDVKNGINENNAYQQLILAMLEQSLGSREKAVELLQYAINLVSQQGKTTAEAMQYIMDRLTSIDQKIGAFLDRFNAYAANMSTKAREALIELRAGNITAARANQLISLVYNEAVKANEQNVLMNQKLDAIQVTAEDGIDALAKKMDTSTGAIITALKIKGYTDAQIAGMNAQAIINAIRSTGDKTINAVVPQLKAILNKIGNGQGTISQDDLKTIIALLESIDSNVQGIRTTVDTIYGLLKQESKKNDVFRTQMIINGRINNQIAMNNNKLLRENNATLDNIEGYLADMNSKVDSLIALANEKPEELKAEISRLRQENSAWLAKINIDENMGTAAIIAKLNDFKNTYIRTERAEINLEKQQNAMMQYAIALLKNKNNDNAAVIEAIKNVENAINSGKEDITAELKQANITLNALLEKVGLVLDEMGKIVPTLKLYGDQILNKFGTEEKILAELKTQSNLLRDGNGKLDLNNLTLTQLKAEVEKIKPQLQTLNQSANTANNYLDKIAKKQIEMDVHIQDIDNGNGISAQELDSLWNMHDKKAFAQAKAYMDAIHVDDMAKADSIIALMKQGNATNNNIYIKLSDFANKTDLKADDIKALLKAVYDYLPELKCKCESKSDCDCNKTHEGKIGDLID